MNTNQNEKEILEKVVSIMKIVLVEDDPTQADLISEMLKKEFSNISLEQIWTESDFGANLTHYTESPPDLFIIDVMLPWAEPSPNMPVAPDKVQQDGYFRAGLRCVEQLANHPQLQKIPVILCTILDKRDLKDDLKKPLVQQIHYVQKEVSMRKELISQIKSIFPQNQDKK